MALGQAITNGAKKIANKIATTELPKIPRIGGTEMSPAMDNNAKTGLRNASHELDVVRTGTEEEKAALGKGQLWHGALYPYSAITDIAKDVVSVPVNAARNLYNTAADVANAQISKHNAKATQKKIANTRKRVKRKKAEPAQYISL